jgi:hypothetical protein
MTIVGFAIVLALCWLILVGVAHVTAWFVHLLVIVAVVAFIVWLFHRPSGSRTRT